MASQRQMKFTAVLLLFWWILNYASALVISPTGSSNGSVVVRRDPANDEHYRDEINNPDTNVIRESEYMQYLKEYFPDTGYYMFYTANADDQLKAFQKANPRYKWYDDFFTVPYTVDKDKKGNIVKYNWDRSHPWCKYFGEPEGGRMDDGEASSKAIARVATGSVLVFGAAEYKTKGEGSFFTDSEITRLLGGMKSKRLQQISHMAKNAMRPDQIMMTEDQATGDKDSKFHYKPGYKEGDKNASPPKDSRPYAAPAGANSHTSTGPSTGLHCKRSMGPGKSSPTCDYTKSFKTLEDVNHYFVPAGAHIETSHGRANQPVQCVAYHTLKTLINLMDQANTDYGNINDGYDSLFQVYKDYMHDSVPGLITSKLMYTMSNDRNDRMINLDGPGMKYFDCTINGKTTACPDRAKTPDVNNAVTTFKLRDANGFHDELTRQGLAVDWITFGDSSVVDQISYKASVDKITHHLANFPIRNDSMVVPNPKDIVTTAIKSALGLRADMVATLDDIKNSKWSTANMAAAPQVYSVPVFVLMQGVDNMSQAKQVAQDIKKQEDQQAEDKKKNLILLIISIVLVFVPVVGPEVAAAAGFATLARVIAILGELGNTVLAIYDTVNHPEDALVNVLGVLLGLGNFSKVSRTEKGLGDLAVIRAKIDPATIKNFGSVFERNDGSLQTLLKNVCL